MNNLPTFPNFRKFTFEDIDWYNEMYYSFNLCPYADVQYQNLMVWLGFKDDLSICKLDNTLILKYTNILNDGKTNLIPLAHDLDDATIEKIIEYKNKNNSVVEISEVPSIICNNLNRERWDIVNDRDSYEYILDTKQQVDLDGHQFSRQRRRMNFFKREHSADNLDIDFFHNIDDNVKSMFLNHLHTMPLNNSEESSNRNIYESDVIKKNLELSDKFGKKAMIIKLNNRIVSLSIISYLSPKAASINHLKVDYSIQYIFQYTIHQLAKYLSENGIDEMNLEQDLGIDGLREFKERMSPSRLLEKVTINSKP